MDKGTLSNVISAVVLALGLALPDGAAQALILSAGMFAFSGGITNSLAVKMLFDRIPGLIGSGVIPARFEEIRLEIKRLIMNNFFDESYLRRFIAEHARDVDWTAYIKKRPGSKGPLGAFIDKKWQELTSPELLQPVLDQQVQKVMDSSLGGFLTFVGADTVRSMIGGFVESFLDSMRGKVIDMASSLQLDLGDLEIEIDEERLVADLRIQVNKLLEKKLAELDAEHVKHMIEDVIRNHLGWLVIWGNVFGGGIGILAHFISR